MGTCTHLMAFLRRIGHLDAHVRQIVALVIAFIAFLFFIHYGVPATQFIAIWDIYALVLVLMAGVTICTAKSSDYPAWSQIAGF
jgi:hypothetical protein